MEGSFDSNTSEICMPVLEYGNPAIPVSDDILEAQCES